MVSKLVLAFPHRWGLCKLLKLFQQKDELFLTEIKKRLAKSNYYEILRREIEEANKLIQYFFPDDYLLKSGLKIHPIRGIEQMTLKLNEHVRIDVDNDRVLDEGVRVLGHLGEHDPIDSGVDTHVALVVVDDLRSAIAVEVENAAARDIGAHVLGRLGPADGRRAVRVVHRIRCCPCDPDLWQTVSVEVGNRRWTAPTTAGLHHGPPKDRSIVALSDR